MNTESPGWLSVQLNTATDRLLQEHGIRRGIAVAEARAARLDRLHLDWFAEMWRAAAGELRRRAERGLDA